MKLRKTPQTLAAILTAALLLCQGAYAGVITKSPDLLEYWNPLSSNGGTYVYANSFVAPDSGVVTDLGLWLAGYATDMYLQVLGSIGGNPASGPDTANIIATTALMIGENHDALDFVNSPTSSSLALVAGQVYWFAATVVGVPPAGYYTVGGHTQNSAYADNGTFWYSNDPAGINFDGQALTPEMAFQVVTREDSRVPVPATLALFGLGLLGLRFSRSRR